MNFLVFRIVGGAPKVEESVFWNKRWMVSNFLRPSAPEFFALRASYRGEQKLRVLAVFADLLPFLLIISILGAMRVYGGGGGGGGSGGGDE